MFDRVIIACDRHGETILPQVTEQLKKMGLDFFVIDRENQDYVFAATKAVKLMKPNDAMVLICGTGVGFMMLANKFKGIRASLCVKPEFAYFARRHENANVLCLASEYSDDVMAVKTTKITTQEIVKTFFETEFEGQRHLKRIEKYNNLGEERA